ncbi:MAG: glycosyltransferase [Alphaproteobacteria bacterium]|nr:glycosyltransferase [Alphaproteobacteria bacterium]
MKKKTDVNQPKVSIIVPVYNVRNYLGKCLESLIKQTLEDIEIICINDGSTDDSLMILKEYAAKDSRIIVVNQQNKGQGGARNHGLEVAKGKYIQFLDSDDYYESICCEEMYNIMEKHNDVDVACFGVNVVYETFEELKESDDAYFKMKWRGKKKVMPEMIRAFSVNCWDKIFRKSFIDEIGLRFPENIRVSEDFCFFWHWMTRAKYLYFHTPKLMNYLRREGSSIDAVLRHQSKHLEESFQANNIIYQNLISGDKWNEYKSLYIKSYLGKLNWLIKCFPVENWQSKQRVIDEYAAFLSQFKVSDFDLETSEEKNYELLVNRNYFAFNAYNSYDVENVHPAYKDKSVNLVFSTDKNYIPYLSVTIASIIENSSLNYNYDIVILYQEIYDYQKRFILSLVRNFPNITIRFFNMNEYAQKYALDKLFTANHITLSAYFRLFVGKIFAEYDRILYLDCDLVVTQDIAELFYTDIQCYPIAAALDTVVCNSLESQGFNAKMWQNFKKYMNDTLGFFDIPHYFNSGVMIIDIAGFNEIEFEYLIDLAERNNRFFHDQNVMNVAFENNYFLLPPIWNYQWHIKIFFTDFKKNLSAELVNLCENPDVMPYIIHYTSHEKPWKNPYHTYADVWWKYARKTPFYEIFMRELCRGNVLTTPTKSSIDEKFLKDIFNYYHDKWLFWKFKILSNLTFGKTRKKYKQLKKDVKWHLKDLERIIGEI